MPSHVPLATTADAADDDDAEVDVDEDHIERLARLRARDPPRPGADSGDAVPIDPDAADVRLHRTLTDEELVRQIGVLRAECDALEAALAEVQVLSDRWVFRSELTEKQLLLDRLEDGASSRDAILPRFPISRLLHFVVVAVLLLHGA
jgi:hypothetical protein